jgi:amino acid transporter
MAEAGAQATTRRDVGVWGVSFLALNGMIGAAIFGLPAKLDAAVGAFAPWLFLLAGAGVMLIALCYADLASRFDRSGGPQLYASAAFGPFVGFQAGWMIYVSRAAALGANATVLAAYAGALWRPLDGPATIIVTVTAITLVNVVGVRRAVRTLGGLTFLKLLPLVLLAIAGLVAIPFPQPALPELGAAEGVSLAALYAFVGFEAATVPAGETRDPKRAIPKALLLTVALVTLFYFLVQAVYSGADIPAGDTPLADLASSLVGPGGAILIGITAILSVLANQLSAVTATSRLSSSLSDQGLLPGWFGRISPRFATPSNSIWLFGGLGLALALTGTFVTLAIISSLARLFAYFACIVAVPRLDLMGGTIRWFRGVALPLVAGSLCIWAAAQSKASEWTTFALFALAGAILYAVARWARRGETQA